MSGESTRTAADAPESVAVALYTTYGELEVSLSDDAPNQDDQVCDLFGRQLAIAVVRGSDVYVAVKLSKGPSRPQTYYAVVRDPGSPTVASVCRAIERISEETDFSPAVSDLGSLASVTEYLLEAGNTEAHSTEVSREDVIEALKSGQRLQFGTRHPGYARWLLGITCETGSTAVVSVTADTVETDLVTGNSGLFISWTGDQETLRTTPDTERVLQQASERRVTRAIDTELERVDAVVKALTSLELDDREICRRVTKRLPTSQGSVYARSESTARGHTAVDSSVDTKRGTRRLALLVVGAFILGGLAVGLGRFTLDWLIPLTGLVALAGPVSPCHLPIVCRRVTLSKGEVVPGDTRNAAPVDE